MESVTQTDEDKVAAKKVADEAKAKAKTEAAELKAQERAQAKVAKEAKKAEEKSTRDEVKAAALAKKAEEKAAKEAEKANKVPAVKKPKAFNMAPQADLKKFREGTKRAKVIELMLKDGGSTFAQIMTETGWDDKTAYEGIRLINLYVGYGLKTSEDGHISAWFPTAANSEVATSEAA